MSACATLTSILGALSSLLMDVPVAKNAFFGATDARVHARYIMALASITNFLAAVAMQPIYMVLALQKIMSCTLNDVSATLETFVNNAQSLAQGDRRGYTTPQLSLTLSFGSGRVQEAIKNAGVATCISEDIRQQVQSSATQVRRPGTSGKPALPGAVAALLSGFLDDAADTVTRAFVGFAYHVIDVFLAWLLGVVRGVQEQFALVHRHMAQIRNIGEFALSEIVIMVDRNLVRDKSTKSCPMSLARCVDCSMWMID